MLAKFLWKRIPKSMKTVMVFCIGIFFVSVSNIYPLNKDENNELNRLWKICQNIITRKYTLAFEFANRYQSQWSTDELASLVSKLIDTTKGNIFSLIKNAYSSISINELANLLCLTPEHTLNIAIELQWSLDETKSFIKPTRESKIFLL
jgi:hypothetical protein